MNPTKLGKNQVLLPSGIVASKDGKYHYWKCSVSGQPTFAKPDYWVKIMSKYGSEENLFKTYVCKKVKDLQKLGKTKEQILALMATGEKLPKHPKAPKVKKEKKVKLSSFKVAKVAKVTVEGQEPAPVVKVYPWSGNPDYFSSPPTAINYAEEADTCHRPDFYLTSFCDGCPLYDKCGCKSKYAPDAHLDSKNNKKKPVIKMIQPFTEEEIAAGKV